VALVDPDPASERGFTRDSAIVFTLGPKQQNLWGRVGNTVPLPNDISLRAEEKSMEYTVGSSSTESIHTSSQAGLPAKSLDSDRIGICYPVATHGICRASKDCVIRQLWGRLTIRDEQVA
jgi:hypothetical protein